MSQNEAPDFLAPAATDDGVSKLTTTRQGASDRDDTEVFPGKKGAAFTLRAVGLPGDWVENLPKVIKLRVHWNYCWGPSYEPSVAHPPGVTFAPMIWGYYSLQGLSQQIARIDRQRARVLLAFNEPDRKEQANLSVQKAQEAWPYLESLQLPLVSPSTSDPMGRWMKEFMTYVSEQNYRIDYVGVHWYGGANAKGFKTRMTSIYQLYRRPLVITEMAVADWRAKTIEDNRYSQDQVLDFMKDVLPFLEEKEWIAAYAWFPFPPDSPVGTSSALFDREGELTQCGKFYSDWQAPKDAPRT